MIFVLHLMKEWTQIRGDPHRIFIFSWKPPLGQARKSPLKAGAGPARRGAARRESSRCGGGSGRARGLWRAMLAIYCTVQPKTSKYRYF